MANSIFPAGSELEINLGWISGNGQTILRLQQDQNLVLYANNSPAYEAPNAYGNGNPPSGRAKTIRERGVRQMDCPLFDT